MSNILTQYHLTFINKTVAGENFKLCKAPDATVFGYIAVHLNQAADVIEFESILNEIDSALFNNPYQDSIGAGESYIEISPTQVTIEDIYSLPITDYKEIIKEWIKFCKTPPFRHQRI